MLSRIIKTISRHRMFERGQRIGVAVSGGADSVCLLHVLLELAPRWELALSVLHLDHGLRGEESRGDAQFVRDLAARLGLPLHFREADVARAEDNLEQAGRKARQAFFLELIQAGVVDRVALGHTRSDQAETVVFRFLRGSGTTGLAGIRPVTAEGFVRPLLAVDRQEVVEYLRQRGIQWHEDSSNQDRAFARNRIRHDLLPALERNWNPRLTETLAATATLAREDEEYWRGVIEPLAQRLFTVASPALVIRAGELASLPPAVSRRLIRRALEQVRGDLRRVDFSHIERILELARSDEGDGTIQVPGVEIARSFDWLRLAPPVSSSKNWRLPVPGPGSVPLPGGNSLISLELFHAAQLSGYNEDGSCLDWDRLSGSLELRNWRPGDQYRRAGRPGEEKVKALFQQSRVPLWERRAWPILTSGASILWVRQFGAAGDYAAGPNTRTVLRVRELTHT